MAVEITERVSDRGFRKTSGGRQARRGFDVTGLATSARETDVLSTLESNEESTAYNAAHPEDTSGRLLVNDQDPKMVSPGHWRVRIGYAVPQGGRHRDDSLDKTLRPARFGYDFGTRNVRVDRDVDGNPILMSSGNAPAQGAPAIRTTLGLEVRKYEPFFDASLAVDMLESVNSDELIIDGTSIVPAGTALLMEMAPTHLVEVGMPEVEVRYRWKLIAPLDPDPGGDTNPFWSSVLDQDFEARADDGNGNTVETQIYDVGDPPHPVSRPVRLNGLGVPMNPDLQLGDGDGLTRSPSSAPPTGSVKDVRGSGDLQATYLWWKVQKLREVARLGLE